MTKEKDGGVLRSCIEKGHGYQTPNEGASVDGEHFALSFFVFSSMNSMISTLHFKLMNFGFYIAFYFILGID